MVSRFGVIADDFTGANDTGAQFEKYGLTTIVLTDPAKIQGITLKPQVLVIDTESRADSQKLASKKSREAALALKLANVKLMYKKIDSTLRGNIGIEIDVIMDELSLDVTIVAPAYPQNQRTTVRGRHLIGKVPIQSTEFAKGQDLETSDSHIPTILQRQTTRKVGQIHLHTVRRGMEALRQQIERQKENGEQIIVVDATTQADLEIIAQTAFANDWLACGSAGLAERFAFVVQKLRKPKPVLMISGSTSRTTARQISRVKEVLGAYVIDLKVETLLGEGTAREDELKRTVAGAVEALAQRKDVVVSSAKGTEQVDRALTSGKKLGLSKSEIRRKSLSCIAMICRGIIASSEIAGLVLVGGDTAFKIIKTVKASGTLIEDEIVPGMPSCRILGGKYEGLLAVTKAGGFGADDALVLAADYLKRAHVK